METFPVDLELRAGDLTLSRPRDEDVPDLVAACRDPETVRFTVVPTPYSTEDGHGYVTFAEGSMAGGRALPLLARDPQGRVVASCGLVRVSWMDAVAEVGYWVAPWARRQGIATRAVAALCAWTFDETPVVRIELQAAAINPGSNGVARRLGFTLEGTLRSAAIQRVADDPDPPRLDMNVYGLLESERDRLDGARTR
ncbi:MAG: GNAT family N-acetyltransferase [Nitriliruptoraceae bacterium]|nr:GNAT family N-acetyltransferase [Nitriliruptoraceae bacterium]